MNKERTPLLTRGQIQALGRTRPTPYLVTSLYFDLARGAGSGKARTGTLKTLIRDARSGAESRELTRKQKQSLEEDFAALERVARDAQARDARAVAVFVASGADLELVFDLPHGAKSRLVVDETPYIRPLVAALDEHPRYLVVLVDRVRARLLAVHLGRVRPVRDVLAEVPGPVREGGNREKNAERAIERHLDDHLTRHLKAVAEAVQESFGDRDYDWIVLGGASEAVAGLKDHLGAALRQRLAGEIEADLEARPEAIAAACRTLSDGLAARRDGDLIERLGEALNSTGLGVAGLLSTLGALRRGAIATLLVAGDFEAPGSECRSCGFLGLEGDGPCPACGDEGSRQVPDLVREMIDRAAESGAEVWHIVTDPAATRLRAMGGVGALLRFRLV